MARPELVPGQQGVQFLFGFRKATPINGVDKVDDTIDGRKVILPQSTGRFVTTQVKCLEFDIPNNQFVRVGMQRGNVDLHAILLEHVQQVSSFRHCRDREIEFWRSCDRDLLVWENVSMQHGALRLVPRAHVDGTMGEKEQKSRRSCAVTAKRTLMTRTQTRKSAVPPV